MNARYLALLPALWTSAAFALDFEFDNGVAIALDSTITYGAQWRIQNQDSELSSRDLSSRDLSSRDQTWSPERRNAGTPARSNGAIVRWHD